MSEPKHTITITTDPDAEPNKKYRWKLEFVQVIKQSGKAATKKAARKEAKDLIDKMDGMWGRKGRK